MVDAAEVQEEQHAVLTYLPLQSVVRLRTFQEFLNEKRRGVGKRRLTSNLSFMSVLTLFNLF